MIAFDLGHHKKVRIWFEDILILKTTNGVEQIKSYDCEMELINYNRNLIIEAFLPRGGRVIYGLLGVRYDHQFLDKKLVVKIITNVKNEKKFFINSLLEPIEHAYIGVVDEYFNYIENGIDRIYKEGKLQLRGQINFCYAAHAIVSSNGWVFEKLSYSVLKLLQMDRKQITKELLIELLS